MNGGMAFLASGADTCVYDPPVDCDPPPNPPFDLKNKVSRIVTFKSGELKNQVLLANVLDQIKPVFPEIRKYVNINTDACIPKFKPAKVFVEKVKTSIPSDFVPKKEEKEY
jgi:hypothetical protein